MKKKILLVGGAGFIGHNLAVKLKKKNYDILIVDNLKVNNFDFVKREIKNKKKKNLYNSFLRERLRLIKKYKIPLKKCDALNKNKLQKIVKKFNPDVLIHLAAVSHDGKSNKNPELAFKNSFNTLFNSLESIKYIKKTQFIYLSSSMVYGTFKKAVVSEKEDCDPIGIYGSLKLSGELLVKSYSNVFGTDYTIIRPSALYGERCISNRVIQIFLERAFENQKIFVKGDGKEKLDFTYIDDFCEGIYKVIANKKKSTKQIFNVTYGRAKSLIDIKKLIKQKFKYQEFTNLKRDKLMAMRGTLSINKARKLINYQPQFDLVRGFKQYYTWYKNIYEKR